MVVAAAVAATAAAAVAAAAVVVVVVVVVVVAAAAAATAAAAAAAAAVVVVVVQITILFCIDLFQTMASGFLLVTAAALFLPVTESFFTVPSKFRPLARYFGLSE